ncbi:metal-dependent hydrolase [bacterium 336/3]|nr:metal-dependent hydrolase [bacterium 336/3]
MLTATYELNNQNYTFDLKKPIDISIPIREGQDNPNCYYAKSPIFETIRSGSFVGSVVLGGSCNYQQITLTPHGNGTHTECYGHISADGATINQHLHDFFALALLITIEPKEQKGDSVIFWEDIATKIPSDLPLEAIIIRTLPNFTGKKTRNYNETNPPYLEYQIGKELAKRNVKHLLVDLPSVDREVDGGKLLMHKAFWQYPNNIRTDATITELVYVEDYILDDIYLLNLQIISLEADACPSKPILYPIKK